MNRVRSIVFTVLGEHLIWLLLAILGIIGLFVRGFWTPINLVNVLWAAAPLGAMVLGMFFVMLVAGLDLSIESIFGFAPTVALVMITDWLPGFSPVLAIGVTLLLGIVAGLVNGLFSVKLKVNPFLVTLGTLLTLRGIAIYLIPEGLYYLPAGYTFLGRVKVMGVPVAIGVLLLLYALAYIIVNHHSFGKSMYAIGNNEHAAYVAGINVERVKVLTFVYAGLFAATGGLLEVGRLQSVVADLGQGSVMMVFAGTILGGTSLSGGEGRVPGIFGAVLVISVIDNLLNLFGVAPSIRQIVFGLILLAAIYLASLQGRLRKQD